MMMSVCVFAQKQSFSGTVTDENGEPIIADYYDDEGEVRYCRIKSKLCVFATESGYCSFTACREVIT